MNRLIPLLFLCLIPVGTLAGLKAVSGGGAGNLTFPLAGPADTATNPNYSWAGVTTTGMYYDSGSTRIGFSVAGTEEASISASVFNLGTGASALSYKMMIGGGDVLSVKGDSTSIFVGFNAGNTQTYANASKNTVVGSAAGAGMTSSAANDTIVGAGTGLNVGSATGWTGVGFEAGQANTGNNSTFVGAQAGSNSSGGVTNVTVLGAGVQTQNSGNNSNELDIGAGATASIWATGTNAVSTEALELRGSILLPDIGASSTGDYLCINNNTIGKGTSVCTLSSKRWKHDIVPIPDGALDSIMKMRPVNFRYNKGYGDSGATERGGFIAEEALKVIPVDVVMDKDGKPGGFNYPEYTAYLTKAIQEQEGEIQSLKQEAAASKGAFPFHKCFFNLLVCAN